jgi:hypothetical protein
MKQLTILSLLIFYSSFKPQTSWQTFLKNLPKANRPVLDYRGIPVRDQAKHAAIITYDVGTSDLQQCADALIRIRAEYLFSQQRMQEIAFHFTNGSYFTFKQFTEGIRPLIFRGLFIFTHTAETCNFTHEALRNYLNIVYTYANTVSLSKELKPADNFDIGTVIIHPGSPGHCTMIIDKKILKSYDTVYMLAEGYMPAQSIYILANPYEPKLTPWYHLKKGVISTSSYEFERYFLKKFE